MGETGTTNKGWRVTFAGMGVNLALGILYTWSVISKGIPAEWGWTEAMKSLPYSIACLVFSIAMVPAGRMQGKLGPRLVATIGGILVGIGMIIASMGKVPVFYVIGFGVLAGIGIGFGYASTTPPAVKWFPAAKTGLIAGIVVAGFGLASVYASPLSNALINSYGLQNAVLFLGIAFLIVVVLLSQLLQPPPKDYVPAGSPATPAGTLSAAASGLSPTTMLKTPQFYLLWFMFACGAGAGLMVISKLAVIASKQAGLNLGFVLVAMLAIGNGAGRIVAGMVSDKIGRQRTMLIFFILQAICVLLLSRAKVDTALASMAVLSVLSVLIGANYGANLSLFPSVTKDYYGLKNFGVNYGLVFTAWGVGGFMLSLLAGKVYDMTHSFGFAYKTAIVLLILAAVCTFLTKNPKPKTV